MDLHRSEKIPDWENTPQSERNPFQKVAAATHGVATPGNVLTATGYFVTKAGLNDIEAGYENTKAGQYEPARKATLRGLVRVGLGRLCDLGDGKVADITGTKSSLGKKADGVADTKLMFDTLDVLRRTKTGPKHVLQAYGLLSLANSLSFYEAGERGLEMNSSLSGKLSTALKWVSLVGYIGDKVLDQQEKSGPRTKKLEKTSHLVAVAAIGLGAYATYGYLKKTFKASEASEPQDARYEGSEGKNYSPDETPPHTQE